MTDTAAFLIGDVARLLRRRFDERARLLGVTRAQWRTLLVLSRNEGANQGQLAELLDVEPITLCRMIDRLADSGLVERRRDPADRRAWRLYLMPASGPILDRLRLVGDAVVDQALDGLDDAERRRLDATLARVRDNLSHPQLSQTEVAHG
jgi:DNA-binding MarR family transcriptional regulator